MFIIKYICVFPLWLWNLGKYVQVQLHDFNSLDVLMRFICFREEQLVKSIKFCLTSLSTASFGCGGSCDLSHSCSVRVRG